MARGSNPTAKEDCDSCQPTAAIDWDLLDSEVNSCVSPLYELLCQNEVSTTTAAEEFASEFSRYLTDYGATKPTTSTRTVDHRTRLPRTTELRLAREKNQARTTFRDNPRQFLQLVRAHHRLVQTSRTQTAAKSAMKQEQAFRRNPWQFAKSVCGQTRNIPPNFSAEEAYSHFENVFSDRMVQYTKMPKWAVNYTPVTTQDTFDLTPITPGLVKKILKKCSSSSTPGPDKVPYSCLKKLPSTHKFLATLYSKILLRTQECPHTWCTANLSLIHKSGDPADPANFRPIALTSVLGKIFHKILASRLEQFAIDNEVIDPSTQKGFLKGINGVNEHTFSMSAILEHARSNGLPVAITFVDLRNAFGSIAHGLIHDTLEALKVPAQVRIYIRDLYSQLKATIRTKQWSSPEFSVKRGVFQGDTLSPIIFLL